ncbi:rhomboid family intramembrane serine protease [Chitinophaga lutea]|uniref:Rhomboid family intramembrane serine protease n=1 Tax=Chitinophaga lutea TaxID=2488634 RepID=A0A3N4PX38_9BACT|nr:rhomboid family intramembrane serine protease [Chitinophaga lutea]RPE12468.1 rhomboid family intramembrane serine protease [Chitinophaga lutea]
MNGTSFQSDIKHWLKQENTVNHLMFVNIGIFLLLGILYLLAFLQLDVAAVAHQFLLNNLQLNIYNNELLYKPWGILTYMFVHTGIFHIFFNMLNLYWFGNMFRSTLGNKRVLPLYLLSGLFGALVYVLFYYALPTSGVLGGPMIGASAAVMCFLVASATLMPNLEIGLLFLGTIKLKWVAVGVIVIDIITIPLGNVGGILAHLGGAAFGYVYVRTLQNNGTDLCAPLIALFEKITSLFSRRPKPQKFKPKKSPLRVVRNNEPSHTTRLDQLLDKINEKGYNSLTSEEKQWLKKYSDEK